jgi:hypothetical protein
MVNWRINDIPSKLLTDNYLSRLISHLSEHGNEPNGNHESGVVCSFISYTHVSRSCQECLLNYSSCGKGICGLCNEPMPIEEKIELVSSLLSPERRVRIKILNELNS